MISKFINPIPIDMHYYTKIHSLRVTTYTRRNLRIIKSTFLDSVVVVRICATSFRESSSPWKRHVFGCFGLCRSPLQPLMCGPRCTTSMGRGGQCPGLKHAAFCKH